MADAKSGLESFKAHPEASIGGFVSRTVDELGTLANAAGTDNQSEANLRFFQLGEKSTDVLQLAGGVAAVGKLGVGVAAGSLIRMGSEAESLVAGGGLQSLESATTPSPISIAESTRAIVPDTVVFNAGKNRVITTLAEDGSPISSTGSLQEYFSGATRGSAEINAQSAAAARGEAGDKAVI